MSPPRPTSAEEAIFASVLGWVTGPGSLPWIPPQWVPEAGHLPAGLNEAPPSCSV